MQQPGFVVVNTAFATPITVIVADAFGNPVTTPTSVTISLGSNPGAATLAGTRTVTTSNGIATFANLKLNRGDAGYTLVATSSKLTSATSAASTVSAVTHFSIAVSTTKITAGVPFSITITALSATGLVVPNYVGTVQILSTDASLPTVIASYTFTAADDGKHTFTGVVLEKPPQVTLTVRDLDYSLLFGSHTVTVAPATIVTHATQAAPKKAVGVPE